MLAPCMSHALTAEGEEWIGRFGWWGSNMSISNWKTLKPLGVLPVQTPCQPAFSGTIADVPLALPVPSCSLLHPPSTLLH